MYTEAEARQLVRKAGLELVEKKLIARTWGNISARISESEFIITPSGRAYEDLTEADLVKVRIDDLSYEGPVKPSSEKGVHAAAYSLRSNCCFVIHTHQFYASAVCAENKSTPFAPCAAYGLSGTKTLTKNVWDVIMRQPDHRAFLMARHGAVCLGETCEEAFAAAEELEENCRKRWESSWHPPKKGIWLDDYAQMFDLSGKPMKGEDPEAVRMIREKNEAAACYVKHARPVPLLIAVLEHTVYVKKYAGLRNKAE